MTQPEEKKERTEETIQEKFPDRGDFPGNDVKPNPDNDLSPDTAHPK